MKINNTGIPTGPGGLPGGDTNVASAARANRSSALDKLGASGAYSQATELSSIGPDQVSISPLAQALQSLRSDSPARQARLDAIASQVEKGTYSVDSATLARSIVQNAISQSDPDPSASGAQ